MKIFHSLIYKDAPAALDYLAKGLGFTMVAAYRSESDDAILDHAQMDWGDCSIMFGSLREGSVHGSDRVGSAMAYLAVDADADVDRLHAQALAAGFTEVMAPVDMDYGGRGSTVLDPEGNSWSLGSYQGE